MARKYYVKKEEYDVLYILLPLNLISGILYLQCFQQLTDYQWIALILLIITTASTVSVTVKRLYDWYMKRKPPEIETCFLLNPLNKPKEKPTEQIRVPNDEEIVLCLLTKCLDQREYIEPFLTFIFDDSFEINFDAHYEKMSFGKNISRQHHNRASCKIDYIIQKGRETDPFLIPLVVKTPKREGIYDLKISFSSDGIKGRREQTLKIDVGRNDFSHDEKYFDSRYFIGC